MDRLLQMDKEQYIAQMRVEMELLDGVHSQDAALRRREDRR